MSGVKSWKRTAEDLREENEKLRKELAAEKEKVEALDDVLKATEAVLDNRMKQLLEREKELAEAKAESLKELGYEELIANSRKERLRLEKELADEREKVEQLRREAAEQNAFRQGAEAYGEWQNARQDYVAELKAHVKSLEEALRRINEAWQDMPCSILPCEAAMFKEWELLMNKALLSTPKEKA